VQYKRRTVLAMWQTNPPTLLNIINPSILLTALLNTSHIIICPRRRRKRRLHYSVSG